jgi:hypothetical protein
MHILASRRYIDGRDYVLVEGWLLGEEYKDKGYHKGLRPLPALHVLLNCKALQYPYMMMYEYANHIYTKKRSSRDHIHTVKVGVQQ